MPTQIVDVSARSRLFREQPLLSHAWVATPPEVLEFLRHPRSELRKLGIRLPADCAVETILQNHDWLTGHSHGLDDKDGVSVFARGEGDGRRFYRVSFYASKTKARARTDERTLLHRPDEEEKPTGRVSERVRRRTESGRRSMIVSPMHVQVHKALAPLSGELPGTKTADEAHRVFVRIVAVVNRILAEQPAVRESMQTVAALLQRPFNPAYSGLYRAHRLPDDTFGATFVSVFYAKAIQLLRASGWQGDLIVEDVVRLLGDPAPTLRRLTDAVEKLDPDFVAHATVEATVRRKDDEVLDARLAEADRLFSFYDPARAAIGVRAAPSRRLELFGPGNEDQWWFVPGLVAYAINAWPTGGEQRADA